MFLKYRTPTLKMVLRCRSGAGGVILPLDLSQTSVLLRSHVARTLYDSSVDCLLSLARRSYVHTSRPSTAVMAPLKGNEADHIREKACRDLLNLLESVS